MKALIKARNPEDTGEVCAGPLWHGGCRVTPLGQPVACAGHEIAVMGDDGAILAVLDVDRSAQTCPLTAMALWAKTDAEDPAPAEDSTEVLGLRGVLARVNLRDFGQMVRGELILVGTSLRLALQSRSAFGLLAIPIAAIRLALLAAVTVVFGAAILVVTIARNVAKPFRRLPRQESRGPHDAIA